MHRHVARCAIRVLVVDLLINRLGDVCGSSTLLNNRCTALVTVKVSGRDPVLAVDGFDRRIHVHVVDALESQSLCFEDEEVDHSSCEKVASEENESKGVANSSIGVRCQETDHEVTQPVERGGERSLLGTSAEREGLADDDPDEGPPGGSERCNEHASAHDHDNARFCVLCGWTDDTNDGEDEQPSCLPETTKDERHTATETLDHPKSRNGHGYVDCSENQLSLDGVLNTGGLEDGGSIVEEVVH